MPAIDDLGLEALARDLIGKTVSGVRLGKDILVFETDDGIFSYKAEDDSGYHYCYFFEFIGLKNLLDNGPVVDVKAIPIEEKFGASVYGFALTTEHPKWGPVTTMFSFQNEESSWYGGNLIAVTLTEAEKKSITLLTRDAVQWADANFQELTRRI